MENRPVVRILAHNVQPEYEERFLGWHSEVYAPLLVSIPGCEEIDIYHIVKNNPPYTKNLFLCHYTNRRAPVEIRNNQKWKDIDKDSETWRSRAETVWWVGYEQIERLQKDPVKREGYSVSETGNFPVIHLEGYLFSDRPPEKYDTWMNKWGREVYIPLLLRLPGLNEYTTYRLIDVDRAGMGDFSRPKIVEYPERLSILNFSNIRAFENYESSLELAAFKGGIQALFPLGLNYQWYVQYLLVKSWRK
jgi:hypothetical protein